MRDASDLRGGDGAGPGPAPRVLRRISTALHGELGALNLRLLITGVLVRLLPQVAFERTRAFIYRMAGIAIGSNTVLAGRLELVGRGPIHRRLHIGSTTYVNTHLYADLSADVYIGDHVAIGNHVVLLTAGHEIGSSIHRATALKVAPIVIGDGAWIGARVTILPGVHVGAGAIVAAGSVVARDVPPNVLVAGVPAAVKRQLEP